MVSIVAQWKLSEKLRLLMLGLRNTLVRNTDSTGQNRSKAFTP